MAKIKFKLYNEGRMVIFRILEQSKDITHPPYDETFDLYSYQASNGIDIRSHSGPILNQGSVYIRGCDNDEDDETVITICQSEQEAIDYIDDVLFAFEEWSDKGYPFGDIKLSDEDTELDDNTYIF